MIRGNWKAIVDSWKIADLSQHPVPRVNHRHRMVWQIVSQILKRFLVCKKVDNTSYWGISALAGATRKSPGRGPLQRAMIVRAHQHSVNVAISVFRSRGHFK